MSRMRVAIALPLLTLFAQAVAADALADLRATLAQLTATAPVHGSFEVTSTVSNSEEAQPSEGKVSVGFEADSAGLRILYPKDLLAVASQEARSAAADPERQTPVRSGADRVRALRLAELLDAAAALSTELLNAQLIESKPATLEGKPVRLLVLKLSPKLSKAESKHMKKAETVLSIWIGSDGVPLAAERTFAGKASFMLMSFEMNQKGSFTYTRSGDRLVTTRYEETQKADGLGQHENSRVQQTVRLQP